MEQDRSTDEMESFPSTQQLSFREGLPSNPVAAALFYPKILKTVFSFLDLASLKKCREVCSLWSKISQPFSHPSSIIYLRDAPFQYREILPKYTALYQLLMLKTSPETLLCGGSFRIGLLGPQLLEILSQLQSDMNSLTLWLDLDRNNGFSSGQFASLRVSFSRLRSLNWQKITPTPQQYRSSPSAFSVENTMQILEIIRLSPNLRDLNIAPVDNYMPTVCYDVLFGPLGLSANERLKQTLQSLTLRGLDDNEYEALRKMNLKLKHLKVQVNEPDTSTKKAEWDYTELTLWLCALSGTLECLQLFPEPYENELRVKLPFQMKNLKRLALHDPKLFGVSDLLPLLNGLTQLETLKLTGEGSIGFMQVDFMNRLFDRIRFPCLRDLRVETEKPENFESNLSLSPYIPHFFQHLKKLSIAVASKTDFLAYVYALQEMQIEELKITVNREDEISKIEKPDTTWGDTVPNFNTWKHLRKLILNTYFYENSPDVFGVRLEKVLPSGLTSLALIAYGEIGYAFLIKLLQEFPLLMRLHLHKMNIKDTDGKDIERHEFQKIVQSQPLIHPYLYLCEKDCGIHGNQRMNTCTDL